jgi:AcrR family transcriptional regulator
VTETPEPTKWRGATAEERRAVRRTRLLEACFELLGTEGSAAAGVRAVCRTSGLSERYFYESFSNIDELVSATQDEEARRLAEVMRVAIDNAGSDGSSPVAATIRASVDYLAEDPRRRRLFAMSAERELDAASPTPRATAERLDLYRELLESMGAHSTSGDDFEANRLALIGSQSQLFLAWASGRLDMERERFVRHAVAVFMAVARVTSG